MRKICSLILLIWVVTAWQALAQEVQVTGKVTDASTKESMPGVNIIIKGTTKGVVSGTDGTFKIMAPTGSTLVASFVGYKSQEIKVTQAGNFNIALQTDYAKLDEVVVIGYGTVKKTDATGSVSTVSSGEFNKGETSSPEQLLIGRVPGVVISTNSGAPGNAATIRIRGGSSLNASNDPLYIIDGVPISSTTSGGSPGPLASINPDDIASFTILKDASATAIYGSRASGGVIIITTKRGSKGFKVSYSVNTSYASLPKFVDVLSASQFRAAVREYAPSKLSLLNPDTTINTNWQKEIYQNIAFGQDHNLSLSGTKFNVPFRVSLGYNNTNGILKTYNFERTTADLAVDPSLFDDYLKIHINVNGSVNKNNFADQSAIGNAISYDPTQTVMNGNTRWRGYTTWTSSGGINGPNVILATPNPVAQLNLTDNTSTYSRSIGNIQLDYKFHFLPDLHANLNLGYDYSMSKGHNNVKDSTGWTNGQAQGQGRYNPYTEQRKNKVLDFYLNYEKQLNAQNQINLMAGYSYASNYRDNVDSSMNSAKTSYYNYAQFLPTKNNLVSFFGRLNYSFADKYLITATIRDDGTSRFALNNRWGIFPSAAFAWKIKNESFLKDSKVVSELKLRLGYGVTGQQNFVSSAALSDWPYLGTYTFGSTNASYLLGGVPIQTIVPNGYNSQLKWESTTTTNIGLDYGFFNNRIEGTIAYFSKKTTNLLSLVPPAVGTNFTNSLLSNIGSLSNKGFEFSILGRIISTKDMYWEVGYNISHDHVIVTKLVAGNNPNFYIQPTSTIINGATNDYAQMFKVGYAPYTYLVYQQAYDANGKPLQGVYVDRNKDGQINSDDMYAYKKPDPDYVMGINSRFRYKNFDFSFAGRVSLGNYNFNNVAAQSTWSNIISPSGYVANTTTQVFSTNFTAAQWHSDLYIQNASFFKMDNISAGYTLPKMVNKLNFHLSASVTNVFTITKYKGVDPEVVGGLDKFNYPRPRTFSVGLRIQY